MPSPSLTSILKLLLPREPFPGRPSDLTPGDSGLSWEMTENAWKGRLILIDTLTRSSEYSQACVSSPLQPSLGYLTLLFKQRPDLLKIGRSVWNTLPVCQTTISVTPQLLTLPPTTLDLLCHKIIRPQRLLYVFGKKQTILESRMELTLSHSPASLSPLLGDQSVTSNFHPHVTYTLTWRLHARTNIKRIKRNK